VNFPVESGISVDEKLAGQRLLNHEATCSSFAAAVPLTPFSAQPIADAQSGKPNLLWLFAEDM
jgi:hypothetical protein